MNEPLEVICESVQLLRAASFIFNPLNAELNPICHLLALLRAHHILHVSRIRVNASGANLTVHRLRCSQDEGVLLSFS